MRKLPGAVFVFAFAAVLLIGCGQRKETLPVAGKSVASPYQEFGTASLHFYEDGVKRWMLDAQHMKKPLADTGTLVVVPVRVAIYDSTGGRGTRILADSGTSDSKFETFHLWGDVYIRTKEGMTVKSQRLRWIKKRRKIISDTYVQIETPKGDVLRGKGLDAVDNFSRFSFKSDVRGKFPDFKRRLEQEDEDFLN
ncbi:MAG: LPS export ABC transporter periplasmic protein LptC [Chitinispirillaceae bacterium]